MIGAMEAAPRGIRAIVDRIVDGFHPEKIILFGSHARGGATTDSDLDLLVVMPLEKSKRSTIVEIGKTLPKPSLPIDILISTPEEFDWRKDVIGTIEHPANREGVVLYDRP